MRIIWYLRDGWRLDINHAMCWYTSCKQALDTCSFILQNSKLKKLCSILFLLIYFNSTFATGIDFHYCNGKLSNVKLNMFGSALCPHSQQAKMECCGNQTFYCKINDHKQIETTILFTLANDYIHQYLPALKLELPDARLLNQFYYYNFIRKKSSREILSFIQVFRI